MGWEVALAGSVVSGIGAAMSASAQGKAGAKAAALEGQQLQENRAIARIDALDQERVRMQEHQRTAAAYIARQPVAAGSATGRNILASMVDDTNRDITNIRLLGSAGDRRYGTAIEQSNLSMNANNRSASMGWIGGLGAAAGGAASAGQLDSTRSIYNRWFG